MLIGRSTTCTRDVLYIHECICRYLYILTGQDSKVWSFEHIGRLLDHHTLSDSTRKYTRTGQTPSEFRHCCPFGRSCQTSAALAPAMQGKSHAYLNRSGPAQLVAHQRDMCA